MKEKYILGLDVGIASCGWSLVSLDEQDAPTRIIDLGVCIFDPGEDSQGQSLNLERREKRCARRVLRRRKHRVDRIRRLLYDYKFLDAISTDYQILKEAFSRRVELYYKEHVTNPFLLKVKALDEPLTSDELMIILVHYAKYRGYLSNRKVEEDSAPKEDRKVLSQIHENESRLQVYRSVSEMFVKDPYFADRIHNDSNSYKMSVTRQMYQKEIETVLDRQVEFGVIPTDFKDKYLEIWSSQRHYAEGPGYYITKNEDGQKIKVRSPYGGNLIERMIGTCQFDGLPRAPKNAPSVELFRVVQSLVNFRYKEEDDDKEYQSLTREEIDLVIRTLQEQEKITYKKLNQLLKKNIIEIKNGSATKKEFINALKKFQEKDWNGDPKEPIKIAQLSEEDKKQFNKRLNDEVMGRCFVSMPTYSVLRKKFLGFGMEEWMLIRSNFEMLDEIIQILTSYKTDSDIRDRVKNSKVINERYLDTILELPNFTGHIHLSLDLVRRLIPPMILLGGYDKAMEELGYNFSDLVSVKEKQELLPSIPIRDIRNQRVIRSLAQTRKVINAAIKSYGLPKRVHVEVASELAKSMDERRRIERNQMNHREDNLKTKQLLVTTFPQYFHSLDDVKPFDLQKYRLWQEQGEFCPYSLEKITIEELFSDNQVQVDHILPYSRTYNDNYYNKTLVKTRANQEKGDRTPYEWMQVTERWNRFVNFIESCSTIPLQKKSNYLYKNLDAEKESEWKNQNLNDTKYIARYLVQFIKGYLNVDTVLPVKGAVTDRLKSRWGLTHVTHSLEQEGYYLPKEESAKKNRDNHLHHILDACIVAVTTPSLIKRVTEYEKLKRYLNSTLVQKDIDKVYDTVTYYNKTTGEVITEHDFNGNVNTEELNEYLLEELKNHSIVRGKKRYCIYYPTPYKDFKREVLLRVFEQNPIILQRDLKTLDNYFDVPTGDIFPIIPVLVKSKMGGALHKETYYGIREYQDGDQTIKIETERVAVNSSRLKLSLLEKMIDRDGGARSNYETLVSWLGNYESGAEAYQKQGYPVNPKSKQPIKRVVLERGVFDNKGYLLNDKCKVDIDAVQKVLIFTSKDPDDKKLYFAALDTLKVMKLKEIRKLQRSGKTGKLEKKLKNFVLTIWWGRDKNKMTESFYQILVGYDLYLEVDKRDFIKVTLTNGNFGYCYACGFSSGKFEVTSPLGDGYDIIGTDNLFSKVLTQYTLTVSKIKDIKLINLSVLGKVKKEKKNGVSTSDREEGREDLVRG